MYGIIRKAKQKQSCFSWTEQPMRPLKQKYMKNNCVDILRQQRIERLIPCHFDSGRKHHSRKPRTKMHWRDVAQRNSFKTSAAT